MGFGTLAFDTLQTSDSKNTGTNKTLDTSFVFNGSAKVWINFNGTGTIATRDSFNVTSITDGGTGLYTVTIANDMGNVNYSTTGAAGENDDSGGNRSLGLRERAAGSQNLRGFQDGVSAGDYAEMCIQINGDLA